MDNIVAMQVLLGVCGLVLLIVLLRQKARFFLEFLVRVGVGAVVILWADSVFLKEGIGVFVGLNFWSLLTSGTLGFPGVALLFLISALHNL
ncbi:MAG: pro-sigmaK processing inhibitor BofA family protein [Lachnospiraceae bacterium]|nr:pro-sigmaK processing inhibitor BofA family protein [Lachnospiraceae bacterium]